MNDQVRSGDDAAAGMTGWEAGMSKRCYYEILEVERTVNDGELKTAFRKLAMKWHPDRNPGDNSSEGRFKEINEAYEVLKDADKRAAYDRFGHAAFEQADPAPPVRHRLRLDFSTFRRSFGMTAGAPRRRPTRPIFASGDQPRRGLAGKAPAGAAADPEPAGGLPGTAQAGTGQGLPTLRRRRRVRHT